MLGLLFFVARLRTQYKKLYWVHGDKNLINLIINSTIFRYGGLVCGNTPSPEKENNKGIYYSSSEADSDSSQSTSTVSVSGAGNCLFCPADA